MLETKFFNFIEADIVRYNGVSGPITKKPGRWRNYTPTSKTNTFIDLVEMLKKDDINVWIWSDQHFNHEKIIEYAKRPFKNADEMNEYMIKKYNELVGENDICLFLGDITFKAEEFKNKIMYRLIKGYKIQIIGNHDFNGKGHNIAHLDFDEVFPYYEIKLGEKIISFTHFPFDYEDKNHINVHGHIHDFETDKDYQINVSVEQTNYQPVKLLDVLKKMGVTI